MKIRTKEDCILDALKYSEKREWRRFSSAVYSYAKKNKWLKDCCSHMRVLRTDWTLDKCLSIAKQYNYAKDWVINSPKSYCVAKRRGWRTLCTQHMKQRPHLNRKWTLDLCKKEASKYTSRVEWEKNNRKSYSAAQDNGWLSQCSVHMKRFGGTSKKEQELLNQIKQKYPSCKNEFFGTIKKGVFGKRFELDIYIPELKLGIEFDGKYWHGKGFRRRWTNDLIQYNKAKVDFFKKLGIQYIVIKEVDWDLNSSLEIEKCFSFLQQAKSKVM